MPSYSNRSLIAAIILETAWLCGCVQQEDTSSDQHEITRLRSLAYVHSVPIANKDYHKGVVEHRKDLAYPGAHLYVEADDRRAMLLGMDGQILHMLVDHRIKPNARSWDLVKPYADGHFLVLSNQDAVVRIDWDSQVIWEVDLPAHHDIAVAENGDICTIIYDPQKFPTLRPEYAMYDTLVVISPDGEVKQRISLAEVVAKIPELVEAIKDLPKALITDPFHTNTIEFISRDLTSSGQRGFKQGDLLFCMRSLNLIGVLDVQREELVWYWGMDDLDRPHCPTLLSNDQILIFDNGYERQLSRVIEMDPVSEQVTFELRGDNQAAPFFSGRRGQAQRLPNGNTLVVSSDEGRILEFTSDGQLAWLFHSFPLETDPTKKNLPYRMPRLPKAPDGTDPLGVWQRLE